MSFKYFYLLSNKLVSYFFIIFNFNLTYQFFSSYIKFIHFNLYYITDHMTGNSNILNAIENLKNGKFILIYDADGREEETDLVIGSQFITPAVIRTMRTDGGGLICTTVDYDTQLRLGLPYLSELFSEMGGKYGVLNKLIPNDIPYDEISSFSLTINHRKTFTGITDNDRALTISELSNLITTVSNLENGHAQKLFGAQFRAPGHVHLLNASKNLLSSRKGHTELATAITIMAGLVPSATICEMMDNNGKARDKNSAKEYAQEHELVFLEGYEIIKAWQKWSK